MQRRVFGDTTRYRVLSLLLEGGGPFSLGGLAAELGMHKCSTKVYTRAGGRHMGEIREAVEKLANEKLLTITIGGRGQFQCVLNDNSMLVQWMLAVRSLRRNGTRESQD